MALITLSQIQLAFGHVALLDHVDFSLQPLERVGLIGRNGAGKSSFLKLLAGAQKPDDGVFQQQQGLRCAYVAQEADFDAASTVFDTVGEPLDAIRQARAQYEVMACDPDVDMAELTKLQDLIDAHDGWSWETRVDTVLTRLQIDGTALISTLSGGQKKRVALAQGLVTAPDVLLLDEPTNHLDMKTIDWLATLMCDTPCALIFITHDRAFLDSVATRIVELDRGQLRSYPGNFAAWQAARALELNAEELENARADKLLAQEEIWIRQGVKARRTRAQYRVNQLDILRKARADRRDQVGQVKLDVDAGARSGKLVAELDNVSVGFEARSAAQGERKIILQNFTATILRGDKIGIVGRNGAGKTTLLRTILGELAPDSGKVKTGSNLQVAYFDQLREQLDLEKTLVDTISPGSEWIEFGGQRKHVMSYLGDFLFSPARANSPVRSLSGGERNRLLLARLFARPANVLVLDEPTNDLDIDTLELLEQLLAEYNGTVFLVSHDRAFLDNVVTSLIVHEGDEDNANGEKKTGYWREYEGGISDWQAQAARAATTAKVTQAKANVASAAKTAGNTSAGTTPVSSTKKLSYKDKQLLEKLPAEIAALEIEQADIHQKLSKPNGYNNDVGALQAAMKRMDEIEALLDEKLTQWAVLEG